MVFWIAYEWGPGNETFTPWLLAQRHRRDRFAWVIPLTALVGFGFTAAQQLASGFTALAGFSMFDRTSRAAWNRLRGQSDTAPGEWSGLGWAARSAIVFPLGTTSVALIQIMTTGEVGVRRHRRVVATSAVLCATLVGMLGAAAATLALVGRNVPALEGATNWILRVLGNPLFWLGVDRRLDRGSKDSHARWPNRRRQRGIGRLTGTLRVAVRTARSAARSAVDDPARGVPSSSGEEGGDLVTDEAQSLAMRVRPNHVDLGLASSRPSSPPTRSACWASSPIHW